MLHPCSQPCAILAHLERVDAPQQLLPLLMQPAQLHLQNQAGRWSSSLAGACRAGHTSAQTALAWPSHPTTHLQLAVALRLVVEPPLLDGVHQQAAAQGHARIRRRLCMATALQDELSARPPAVLWRRSAAQAKRCTGHDQQA